MEESYKVREAIDGGHHVLYKVMVVPDQVHILYQLPGDHIEDVLNGAVHWVVRCSESEPMARIEYHLEGNRVLVGCQVVKCKTTTVPRGTRSNLI